MTRLDSAIRRLQAQRACLDRAAELVQDTPGPVLELGLGNGRTYDHLRARLAGRDIFVFERAPAAHPDSMPPADRLILGNILETLAPCSAARPGGAHPFRHRHGRQAGLAGARRRAGPPPAPAHRTGRRHRRRPAHAAPRLDGRAAARRRRAGAVPAVSAAGGGLTGDWRRSLLALPLSAACPSYSLSPRRPGRPGSVAGLPLQHIFEPAILRDGKHRLASTSLAVWATRCGTSSEAPAFCQAPMRTD